MKRQRVYKTYYSDIKLTVTNYFLPLDKISSEATVSELIVEPLIQMDDTLAKFKVTNSDGQMRELIGDSATQIIE